MRERIEPELLNHLKTEFGRHGERAVGFLNTATHLLDTGSNSVAPRLAETIVYCLREAMDEIPKSQTRQGETWRSNSRDVVRAKGIYERSCGVPGMDEQGALQQLLQRIQTMSAFHEGTLDAVVCAGSDRGAGGVHLSKDLVAALSLKHRQVVLALQVQPEARAVAEVTAKP